MLPVNQLSPHPTTPAPRYARAFKSALSLIAGLTCGLAISAAQAQSSATFTALAFLPGHVFSSALGVSGDGNVVVGESSANPAVVGEAVRWVGGASPSGLGFLPNRNTSLSGAVNADGSVIVGVSNTDGAHTEQGFRWLQDTSPAGGTMSGLPIPSPQNCAGAWAVSADGTVVAGTANICYTGSPYQAFRWTSGVSTGLGQMQGYPDSSQIRGMNSDGSVLVGLGEVNDAACSAQAFRWANGSYQPLGIPQGKTRSLAFGSNSDGSVIVGYASGPCTDGPLAYSSVAFRWVQDTSPSGGTISVLPFLAGGTFSSATSVSADGSVVVGQANSLAHPGGEAFRWTPTKGSESIATALANAGVNIAGWTLVAANGVSADGTLIVGDGINPSGQEQAWVAAFHQDVCPDDVQHLSSCVGKCNSSLAHQYGDYATAASALGYSSAQDLQNAVKQFCKP